MKCIVCQSPPPPILSELRFMRPRIFPPAKKPQRNQENRMGFSFSSVQTKAAAVSPVFILAAATSRATSGSLSVVLQTGAVMLFAYWIANFVVPGIIIKDFETDDPNEKEDNPSDG